MSVRIMRRPEVIAATGLSRNRIDALEAEGEFPRRVKISSRAIGWRSTDVEEWINSRPYADEAPSENVA